MDSSTLISLLTGSGVAGVFCLMFVFGWIVPKHVYDDLKAENAQKDATIKFERDRADSAVAAAQATRDIMAAIQFGQAHAPQLTPGQQP